MLGYHGKILRVDLTQGKVETHELDGGMIARALNNADLTPLIELVAYIDPYFAADYVNATIDGVTGDLNYTVYGYRTNLIFPGAEYMKMLEAGVWIPPDEAPHPTYEWYDPTPEATP